VVLGEHNVTTSYDRLDGKPGYNSESAGRECVIQEQCTQAQAVTVSHTLTHTGYNRSGNWPEWSASV